MANSTVSHDSNQREKMEAIDNHIFLIYSYNRHTRSFLPPALHETNKTTFCCRAGYDGFYLQLTIFSPCHIPANCIWPIHWKQALAFLRLFMLHPNWTQSKPPTSPHASCSCPILCAHAAPRWRGELGPAGKQQP